MVIIVGSIIKRENKILMIKEAKKECIGKWSFSAGHLEKGETIQEGALRETFEETGCTVKLKSLLPIIHDVKNEILVIHFLSEILEENEIIKKDEIMEKKWMTIQEIRNMERENLRFPDRIFDILDAIENKEGYALETIKDINM